MTQQTEPSALETLLAEARVDDATFSMLDVEARFPSLDAGIHTDIKGWTLADMIDDRQFQILPGAGRKALDRFVGDDGTVAFEAPAILAVAPKR